MKITRAWSMPNHSTFEIEPIAALIGRYKPGGVAISFGWNSGGIGERNGFDLVEILIVAHGGAHNDTIATVERKRSGLFDQLEAA